MEQMKSQEIDNVYFFYFFMLGKSSQLDDTDMDKISNQEMPLLQTWWITGIYYGGKCRCLQRHANHRWARNQDAFDRCGDRIGKIKRLDGE
jgi:hypothetical protein